MVWERLYPLGGRCIAAPTYPWQRVRCWLDAAPAPPAAATRPAIDAGPLTWRAPVHSAVHPQTVLTEVDIGAEAMPSLIGHGAGGTAVVSPEKLYELVLAGTTAALGATQCRLGDVATHRSLELTDSEPRTLQLVVRGEPGAAVSFECYGRRAGTTRSSGPPTWELLASGTAEVGGAQASRLGAAPSIDGPGDRIYRLRWRPTSIRPDHDAASRSPETGSWLVFGDGGTTADTVREYLESHSQSCVVVEPGPDYRRLASGDYRLDPSRPTHFRRLLAEAFGGDRPACRGVVHLWGLLAAPPTEASADSLDSAAVVGPLSVVHLVQELSLADWPASPRLWLVTRAAQVTDADSQPVSIAQAPVWGLGRTIDHEHPELRCTRVDLSADGGPDELRALFHQIWTDDPENDVALRGCRRYAARLTPAADVTNAAGPTGAEAVTPTAGGTYLITGGLGALGLQLAAWLVGHGARHLVLMGRRGASQPAQETIKALRANGAEVTVARGDVARTGDVAAVLESIDASMPPLRGVLHAAGTVDDAIVAYLDEWHLRNVMAPKIRGAWNLHTMTLNTKLDFFVMFSSAASVLGSPGAANYGAANAFLDALAWHRRGQDRPALSINWGPWAGLGFSSRSEPHRHFAQHGGAAMPAAECLRALSTLLASSAPQAVVVDVDWARWGAGRRPRLLTELPGAPETAQVGGPASGLDDALRGTTPHQRQRVLQSYLADLVADKLGLKP